MNFIELLDYEKPSLYSSIDEINLNCHKIEYGEFYISNIGEGLLTGTIKSNSKFINFTPENFEGNKIKIGYKIDVDECKTNGVIKTNVIITSNGGEKKIPVKILVVAPSIETEEMLISQLNDFFEYSKIYYKNAQLLFNRIEFLSWLSNTDYNLIPIYEQISKDTNKERALENFFLMSRLKDEVKLTINKIIFNKNEVENINNELIIYINYDEDEIFTGEIILKKSCWGYIENNIDIINKEDWFDVSTYKIINKDFKNEIFSLIYFINSKKINKNISTCQIYFGQNLKLNIKVKRTKVLESRISKESFKFDEEGYIFITKYIEKDIKIEIIAKDNFIKFESKKYYLVNNTKKIIFNIKLTALQIAQMNIKKQPFIESEIYIKYLLDNEIYNNKIILSIGNDIMS